MNPKPRHLTSDVLRFAIFGNDHWVVSSARAHQFGGSPTPTDRGYAIPNNETPHYMWAGACSQGAQALDFHRTIWLPGQPQSLEFFAGPTFIYGWASPFSVIKLVVNRIPVLTSHYSEVTADLVGATLPKAFHLGKNDVHLFVTKKRNPRSIKSCGDSHPKTRIGVQTVLAGQVFPADLAVRQPAASESPQWYHVQPGGSQAFAWTFTTRNNGPSTSGAGRFTMRIQAGSLQVPNLLTWDEQPPMHDCTVSGLTVTCLYDDWLAPGARTAVTVGWKVTVPTDNPNNYVEDIRVDWNVMPGNQQPDPTIENNTAAVTVYLCYPAATDSGCDKH